MPATTTSATTTATPAELRLLAEELSYRFLSCSRKCRLRFRGGRLGISDSYISGNAETCRVFCLALMCR
jgi:hypothetical protein